MSSCFTMTFIATILKNNLDLHSKTQTNNDKFWKMGTIVGFLLLVLESLKYSSKAETPINRSAKESSVGTLLLVDTINYLFILFFLFLFFPFYFYFYFFIFYFYFFHIFTENNRLICIMIATVVIGWHEWIKDICLLLRRLNLAILLTLTKIIKIWVMFVKKC